MKFPISFSIPEEKLVNTVKVKTKVLSTLIPGNMSTYTFQSEETYYKEYQESVFALTYKKGGYDCMRHYEILANGCIPWFEDLDQCPDGTMTHFPKSLVKEAMVSSDPTSYIPQLLEYTQKHLTTKAMAQYILDTCNMSSVKKILFLSNDPRPDYLRCLMLIGFKELLGKNCIESIIIPHIYDDYEDHSKLYGHGFTYTRVISSSIKPELVHVDDIRNHVFDLVIYGSIHRGKPYWELITKFYKPSEIILLCGEDIDYNSTVHNCSGTEYAQTGCHLFVRELLKHQ